MTERQRSSKDTLGIGERVEDVERSFYGSETILHDAAMVDTGYHTFGKHINMYSKE